MLQNYYNLKQFLPRSVVPLKSYLDVQQTMASLLNKNSCLAAALGAAIITTIIDVNLVTLGCGPIVLLVCSTN